MADRLVVQDDLLLDDPGASKQVLQKKPSAGAKGQIRRNTHGTYNPE
jgi:hypothetical protein